MHHLETELEKKGSVPLMTPGTDDGTNDLAPTSKHSNVKDFLPGPQIDKQPTFTKIFQGSLLDGRVSAELSSDTPDIRAYKQVKLGKSVKILERGGVYVKTSAGPIQIGCPPETIKDCMTSGLDIPQIYIVPPSLFSTEKKINMFEFEFPCFYNTFIKKRKTNIVTFDHMKARIEAILQESLLGPTKEDIEKTLKGEFEPDRIDLMPNLYQECLEIRDPGLDISTLVNFTILNRKLTIDVDDDLAAAPKFTACFENVKIQFMPDFESKQFMLQITDGDLLLYDNDIYQGLNDPGNRAAHKIVKEQWKVSQEAVYAFTPPTFGVTMVGTSHGFDPNGLTSGFLLWMNDVALIVDPPVDFDVHLKSMGIPPRLVSGIILTHCHADHDSGTFQKVLQENRIVVYTTSTIMHSFLRKYANVCGYSSSFLSSLFRFHELLPHRPAIVNSGAITCHYACHTIPCIGFTAEYGGKTMYYSGDHANSPVLFDRMKEKEIMGEERYNFHSNMRFNKHSIVLHECGIPPIHTPAEVLMNLPDDERANLYVVHCSEKSVPNGLRLPLAASAVPSALMALVTSKMQR